MSATLPSKLTVSRDSERCVSIHDEDVRPPRYVAALDDTNADNPRTPEELATHAALLAAAPELLATLIQALSASGFRLNGPTDHRAAEDGEPVWVCNARAVIASTGAGASWTGSV